MTNGRRLSCCLWCDSAGLAIASGFMCRVSSIHHLFIMCLCGYVAGVVCRFNILQTLILAVIAGTLFLRGHIPTDTIQGGTLYLGLIFFSIVSVCACVC